MHKHCVGYYHVTDATAIGFLDRLEKVLFHERGLDRKYVNSQTYDGTSVMSDAHGGTRSVMKKHLADNGHQFVPYIHCPQHPPSVEIRLFRHGPECV